MTDIEKLEKEFEAEVEMKTALVVEAERLVVHKVEVSDLGLSEALIAKLAPKVNRVVGDDYRVVFLSFFFESDKVESEVAVDAIRQLIVPQLEKLDSAFEIVGCLCPPSILRLTSPAARKILEDRDVNYVDMWTEFNKVNAANRDIPPFEHVVFCFPAVAWKAPIHQETEREVVEALRAAGIDAVFEGHIGTKRVLKD